MASLRNTITDKQYEWLSNNLDTWYDEQGVTITKYTSWTYILVMKIIPGSTIADIMQVNDDGTSQGNAQRNVGGTDYWSNVYNGVDNTMLYYYVNHGDNLVDSYDTIGLPTFPIKRVVVDTQDLKAVKDSEWKWINLYRVLTSLQPSVEVIPSAGSERQALAYEWDSNMSWRILSPYMMNWVKGYLTESDIALYLKAQFADKWNKLYDVMTAEYNPLDNYKMHEVEHTDDVKDEDTSTSSTATGSNSSSVSNTSENDDTTTENLNTTVTSDTDSQVDQSTYAFNSNVTTPVAKNTTATDNETKTLGQNTSRNQGEESSTTNTDAESEAHSSGTVGFTADNDKDRELDREGNIGVTTSQQLIEAELKVRQNIILETVRDDIIGVMTLPYYGGKY